MTDDAREILKAAGVECAEVDAYMAVLETEACPECGMFFFEAEQDWDAILALARLAAKYKWQRDATVGIAGYNEEEAQELLDEVDMEWHEEERRRRK